MCLRAVCFASSSAAPLLQRSTSFASSRKPLTKSSRAASRRANIVAIASNGIDDEGEGDEVGRPSTEEVRRSRVNDLRERLERLDTPDARPDPPAEKRAKRYLDRQSQLIWLVTELPGTIVEDCSKYLENPWRKLTAASLAILFGFFSATSASTIIGSVADWDPLAAAVLLVWTESFTRFYYQLEERNLLYRLANAFKIGLIYGMAVDAFKLST
jgi:hypothetical protein